MLASKLMFKMCSLLLVLVFLQIQSLPVQAQSSVRPLSSGVVFTVNSTLDQPDDLSMPGTCHTAANTCTLRAAIMQANRTSGVGATIILSAGIYKLTIPSTGTDGEANGDLNLTSPAGGNPIITISGAGAANTIIDANQLDRVFMIHAGRTTTLSDITIRNGYRVAGGSGRGGGIYNDGTLTLTDSTVSGNSADIGGGIINSLGTLAVTNSRITDNSANYGGGFQNASGAMTMTNRTLSGNSAGITGGGIYNDYVLTVMNSTLSDNSALDGGGIYNDNDSTLTVTNSTLSGNSANYGGGIFNDFKLTVTNSTLSGNSAQSGGGVYNNYDLIMVNDTISGNQAYADGGGIYNGLGTSEANVYNSSIVSNVADVDPGVYVGRAGGIFNADFNGAVFNLRNSLVAGNSVSGAPIYDECSGTLNSYGRNIIWAQSVVIISDCVILIPSGSWTLLNDLALLGPLQNNGGPTATVALLPGSNAIDGGDPVFGCIDYNGNTLSTDQRGFARPVGAGCDVGAMELVMPTFGDVPLTFWSWQFIEKLYANSITGGCTASPLMYCPGTSVTRAQMAVFLLRGIYGSTYLPPAATGTTFSDVPSNHWAAAWIEQLAAEGITGGCGNGNYCPQTTVTRDQMAVFLLRAKYGALYTPPAATGTFADVPANYWAAAWIEQLAAEGITSGCGGGNYCPANAVDRAQMAVFLVRTFNLP
jgi:hypothetical protein